MPIEIWKYYKAVCTECWGDASDYQRKHPQRKAEYAKDMVKRIAKRHICYK